MSVYINKIQYYFIRVVCFIGVNFFGFWGIFFITGLFIDIAEQNVTDDVIIGIAAFLVAVWVLLLILNHYKNKVKIYDSFFSTDADGIVYPRIIACSLGIPEKKVIADLRILTSMHFYSNCTLDESGENVKVILSNAKVTKANQMRYHKVICPHCGGENRVREGFVYGCEYCSGKIE